MGRKVKYSAEEKIMAVKEYQAGNDSMTSVAKRLGLSFTSFKQWVKNYEASVLSKGLFCWIDRGEKICYHSFKGENPLTPLTCALRLYRTKVVHLFLYERINKNKKIAICDNKKR